MGPLKAIVLTAALLPSTMVHAAAVDRWAGEIAEASARFGIPAEWVRRVIRVESGGRTLVHGQPVVSPKGAMGLMQLMPGTWRDMRGRLGLGSDPFDPHDNILAGTAYLRMMYERFGFPGMFAAYNAGPRRYASSLSRGRPLPNETHAYLVAIAASGFPAASVRQQGAAGLFSLLDAAQSDAARTMTNRSRRHSRLFIELDSYGG